MSKVQRVAFLAAAAVVVVIAVVAFGTGGDSKDSTVTPVTTPPVNQAAAPVAPKPRLLKAGAEPTLTYTQGDVVRFRVVHPTAEEVHVHGYDFTFDLKPGVIKTISFPARIEGQFEIELEQSATPLAKLVVNPR